MENFCEMCYTLLTKKLGRAGYLRCDIRPFWPVQRRNGVFMGRIKQIIILALIFIMALGCVYLGIQIKNRPEVTEEEVIYHGSYRETIVTLPVINKDGGEEYLQLMRGMDNVPELYTVLYNEDRSIVRGYKKYVLSDDLKWTEAESAWMALEFFSDTSRVIRMMSYAETGSLYVLLHDLSTEEPVADEVVRVSTAGNVERVGVRGLYKTDDDGNQIPLRKMFIADNSICITDSNYNSYAYSLANGELYASGKNGAYGSLASDGSYLYILSEDMSTVTPFAYDGGTAIKPRKLWERCTADDNPSFTYEQMDYQLLYADGTLYLSCQDGIYRFDMESVSWKKMISGMDCLFGKPSVVQQDFISVNNRFYMFGWSLSGDACMCVYDMRTEEEDQELSRTLFRVSSYRRDPAIIEAAVAFQHKNPSLEVILDVALDNNPKLSPEEYRSQIQTSLNTGNAADVLVCDELDYNSLMASGTFENISDLMKPLYTAADLYGNITNAMSQNKIFVTPAKFDVFLRYGTVNFLSNSNTLETMASISSQKKTAVLGTQSVESLARLFCSFYEQEYISEGVPDIQALAAALTYFKDSAKLEVPVDSSADSDSTANETASEATNSDTPEKESDPLDAIRFAPNIARIDGTDALALFYEMLAASDYTYNGANARFFPRSIVGINAKSASSKTAREFIRMLYSADVQNANVGNGLPMRRATIHDICESLFSDILSENDFLELDFVLRSLNTGYNDNAALFTALTEHLPAFFAEELTAEETAGAIIRKLP